jgi:hypothetical protein
MRATKAKPGAGDAGPRWQAVHSGRNVVATNNLIRSAPQGVRAEITGSDRCRAAGITAHGHSPVLKVCPALIAAGVEPDRPLFGFRRDVLCLVVRSLGEAAQIEINSKGSGFVRRRPAVRRVPLVRLKGAVHR